MSEKKDETKKPRGERAEKARKKWTRPEIRTGKLFEVNSLACGKVMGSTGQCNHNPTTS